MPSGFGLCNTGKIRNGSDAKLYGSAFGDGNVIGVHLDSLNGILSFSINSKPLGIAFSNIQLKQLYAAVSFTQKADFTLVMSDKAPPQIN